MLASEVGSLLDSELQMWLQDSTSFCASGGCASLRGSWTGKFLEVTPLSPRYMYLKST